MFERIRRVFSSNCSFYDMLYVYTYFLKLINIFYYTPVLDENDYIVFKLTIYDKIYFILTVSIQICLLNFSIKRDFHETNIKILDIGNRYFQIFGILFMFSSTITSPVFKKQYSTFMRTLTQYDRRVSYIFNVANFLCIYLFLFNLLIYSFTDCKIRISNRSP